MCASVCACCRQLGRLSRTRCCCAARYVRCARRVGHDQPHMYPTRWPHVSWHVSGQQDAPALPHAVASPLISGLGVRYSRLPRHRCGQHRPRPPPRRRRPRCSSRMTRSAQPSPRPWSSSSQSARAPWPSTTVTVHRPPRPAMMTTAPAWESHLRVRDTRGSCHQTGLPPLTPTWPSSSRAPSRCRRRAAATLARRCGASWMIWRHKGSTTLTLGTQGTYPGAGFSCPRLQSSSRLA